uniref:Uncharacterized protein n=1 Tax=Arundo donax TaxID=35708 RepID=A0A0A9GR19_ARUDO
MLIILYPASSRLLKRASVLVILVSACLSPCNHNLMHFPVAHSQTPSGLLCQHRQ